MKISQILALVLLVSITACKNDDPGSNEEVRIPVLFSFNKELVSFSDIPQGRTLSDPDKTYFLLRVNDITNGVIYANGVYEDIPSQVELLLVDDRSYEIEAIALKKGDSYGIATGSNATGAFLLTASGNAFITDSITYSNSNTPFKTTYRFYTTSDSSSFISSPLPPIETFYTSLVINDVSSLPESTNLRLTNNTFGIHALVEGNYTGSIRIKLSYNNSNPAFIEDIHNSEDPEFLTRRSFFIGDLRADSSYWSENYLLEITHLDTVESIPLTNVLYDSFLPFKRLHLKTVQINAPSDTTTNATNQFTFTLEDTAMIQGDTLVVN